jgi:Flp pilus assembly protein TadG
MKAKVRGAAAQIADAAMHFPNCNQRAETHAERRRAASAVSQVTTLSGICAGAPGADIIAYVRTQQDVRQFRTGYLIMGVVCAFLMLIELAVLPGVRTTHHHTHAAATAGVTSLRGR